MAAIKDLEKYLNFEFSSGPYTGSDYKTFQNKYINYLRSMCREKGWELMNVGRNHYEFSAFIKYRNKYVYISIIDVRFFNNAWYNRILYRTAQNGTDYQGEYNQYTNLPDLQENLQNIFNKENG